MQGEPAPPLLTWVVQVGSAVQEDREMLDLLGYNWLKSGVMQRQELVNDFIGGNVTQRVLF